MVEERVHSFPIESLLCAAPSRDRIRRRNTAKELKDKSFKFREPQSLHESVLSVATRKQGADMVSVADGSSASDPGESAFASSRGIFDLSSSL